MKAAAFKMRRQNVTMPFDRRVYNQILATRRYNEQSWAGNVLCKWYHLVRATKTATQELFGSKLVTDPCRGLWEVRKGVTLHKFLGATRLQRGRSSNRRRAYK